jgi:hypothetical protein
MLYTMAIGDKVVLFGGSTGVGTETYANDT